MSYTGSGIGFLARFLGEDSLSKSSIEDRSLLDTEVLSLLFPTDADILVDLRRDMVQSHDELLGARGSIVTT